MGSKGKELEVIARGVCIVDEQLLLCHSKGADNTFLPGGHVEFKESAQVSLAREIDEEMGRGSHVGAFLGAVEHTFKQKGRRHCEVNFVFEVDIDGVVAGEDPGSAEDHIEFLWVPLDEVMDSGLEPGPLRDLIPDWHDAGCPAAPWGSTF